MKVMLFNISDYLFGEPSSFMSLNIGYLKSYFDRYSPLAKEVDIRVEREEIEEKIVDYRPDVIGMSVTSEFYDDATHAAWRIKSCLPDIKIIIGGYHITALPDYMEKPFDYGVLGEGEQTFLELIHSLYDKKDISAIPGLVYRKGDEIVKTAQRDLIPDLDRIPPPYRGKTKGFYTNIITSRGCPFGCAFCSTTSFWHRTIRFNSAEFVVSEMFSLINDYGVRHISLWDDLFIGDVPRLQRIVELMKKEKVFKRITFGASARADLIVKNPEILDIFREMNVVAVSLGFESGSERMLRKMKGNNASVENNKKAIELLLKYPFLVSGGFIIGSPGETEEDLEDTYNFVKTSGLHGGYAAVAIPYPGTQYWSYGMIKDLVKPTMDFRRLKTISQYKGLHNFILLSQDIDRDKFLDYGRRLEHYFYWAKVKSYITRFNFRLLILFLRNLWELVKRNVAGD